MWWPPFAVTHTQMGKNSKYFSSDYLQIMLGDVGCKQAYFICFYLFEPKKTTFGSSKIFIQRLIRNECMCVGCTYLNREREGDKKRDYKHYEMKMTYLFVLHTNNQFIWMVWRGRALFAIIHTSKWLAFFIFVIISWMELDCLLKKWGEWGGSERERENPSVFVKSEFPNGSHHDLV